jgi:hypothetical protein
MRAFRLTASVAIVLGLAWCQIHVGPKVKMLPDLRSYPPECVEGYDKCSADCKGVSDSERRKTCDGVCEKDRTECADRVDKAPQ